MKKLLGALSLAWLVVGTAWAGIDAALVGSGTSATSTVTTSAGTTAASGSTFVICAAYGADHTNSTPTDSKGNTYTIVGSRQTDTHTLGEIVMYKASPGDSGYVGGGASHTATMTFSPSAAAPAIWLVEVTGGLSSGAFDKTAQRATATSPFTVTTPTLSQANEVVVTCIQNNHATTSTNTYSSSNTTILGQVTDSANFWTGAISKLVVAATTAVTPSFTDTQGDDAGLVTGTFKAAASASGGSNQGIFSVGP